VGHGWDQNTWGGDWPGVAELDAQIPDNPVYLTAKILACCLVEILAALRLAGITASTPDPAMETHPARCAGAPTGILFESCLRMVETAIPEPGSEALAKSFQQLIPQLWRMGLTGVHDFDGRALFWLCSSCILGGWLLICECLKSIPHEFLPQAGHWVYPVGFGDDFLRVGSVKAVCRWGALGTHTGAMTASYVDEPENRGILL